MLSNKKKGLQDLCDEFLTPVSVVIEIGSYRGENTLHFAKNAAEIYCVDPWQDYQDDEKKYDDMIEAEAHFDVQVSSVNNVHKFRTKSESASKVITNRIAELVYIDSKTTYESMKKDIELWWPKVKFGGALTGSNYILSGVKKAVDEIFGKADRVYLDNSWAVMKFPGRWQDEK